MRPPTVLHALAFTIGGGTYAWSECSGRGGPWHVKDPRWATDVEAVTCLRCLDILTRPDV